ncbi:MAG: TRAP-type mannitol/chloroaromatic compound transport system permease small subunit [Myxococcota bacterium]|jgi:TRAP-type mannitol/chloroaromatic compound transport system permease small subunit
MNVVARLIDRISEFIGQAVSWICLLMVLLGALNAVSRYLGRFVGVNLSSTALTEAQWYMFSAMFLLGGAWALKKDSHVRVDVLYGRLSKRGRAIIDITGTLLFLLPFCVFGVWTSWGYVANSIAQREVSPDPGGLLRYPIKALIPIAFVLLGLQAISMLIGAVGRLRGGDDAH